MVQGVTKHLQWVVPKKSKNLKKQKKFRHGTPLFAIPRCKGLSPLERFLSSVDHHVISERVLLPQHLAADVAGVFLLQEYLVLVCHVAVLCGLPSVPGTDGTQPLFMGNLLELCNWRQELFKSFLIFWLVYRMLYLI